MRQKVQQRCHERVRKPLRSNAIRASTPQLPNPLNIFKPPTNFLRLAQKLRANTQIQPRAQRTLHLRLPRLRDQIPQHPHQERTQYIYAPFVWYQGKDLADVEQRREASKQIARALDAVGRLGDI